MSILADTIILPRRTQPGHQHHAAAVESVGSLLDVGQPVYFNLQIISEFWNVATRPVASHGLGFSVPLTQTEVAESERFLTLLPESPVHP